MLDLTEYSIKHGNYSPVKIWSELLHLDVSCDHGPVMSVEVRQTNHDLETTKCVNCVTVFLVIHSRSRNLVQYWQLLSCD